jgi:DNA-directed RNA polymerase subunit RPC12/RpoP
MKKLKCLRCGHEWKQRGKKIPKACPSCHSKVWNRKDMKEFIDFLVK